MRGGSGTANRRMPSVRHIALSRFAPATPGFRCAQSYIPIISLPPLNCLPGSTSIDTPQGGIPIKELQVGMQVWTVTHSGSRERAEVIKTLRRSVSKGTLILHLTLSDGRKLVVSPNHPMLNGISVSTLAVGDILDGSRVVSIENTPLDDGATYDILTSGETGGYWANNILLGSTLANAYKVDK